MKIPLCRSDELAESHSKGCPLASLNLFIVRKDGQVYGYQNECPHLGVELEWQQDQFLTSEASHIICSTHGALFEIDNGACIYGPCAGQSLTPVPVIEEQGQIFYLAPEPESR